MKRVQEGLLNALSNLYDDEIQSFAEGLGMIDWSNDDRDDLISNILQEIKNMWDEPEPEPTIFSNKTKPVAEPNPTATTHPKVSVKKKLPACPPEDIVEEVVNTPGWWYTASELKMMSKSEVQTLAQAFSVKHTGAKSLIEKLILNIPLMSYQESNLDNVRQEHPDADDNELTELIKKEFDKFSTNEQQSWAPPRLKKVN